MDTESRITELETRLAFQEQTLLDLDKVICAQQTTIDKLRRQFGQLHERLEDMSSGNKAPDGPEIPPHY